MTKRKNVKRSLLMSALSLMLCMSMFVGSTFAWFTDTVTTAGNTIQAGKLEVALVDANDNSLEGAVLEFVDQDANALWEPGCTYTLQDVYVVNKGSLALQYKMTINGIVGDATLLEALDWKVTVDSTTTALDELEGYLLPNEKSGAIAITGHMKEEAGNEYQGLTLDNISISVLATQYTHEADSFDVSYDDIAIVSDEVTLRNALAEGKSVVLAEDVELDANAAVTIPAGAEVTLDLNGKTLSGVTDKSGNADMFLVKGEMNVVNGTVEMSTTNNQGWNAMTAIFDVTAGGVLNIKDATINNLGGTDMNFCVHMNNWGEVTLNVDNSTLSATYCAVRLFNSGNDMNNVTITNSHLAATRAFWVHNYTLADFGNDANKVEKAAARINSNVLVENPVAGLAADDTSNLNPAANNTFVGSISYGFTDRIVYYSSSNI